MQMSFIFLQLLTEKHDLRTVSPSPPRRRQRSHNQLPSDTHFFLSLSTAAKEVLFSRSERPTDVHKSSLSICQRLLEQDENGFLITGCRSVSRVRGEPVISPLWIVFDLK